jgi:uncharacterized surface protein with fasciclin (FAS1) repeats
MLSNHRRTLVLSLLAVPGIALLQGCGDDGTNLWGYIDTQPDLKTLAAAIRAAGLVDAVAASPRTLFAPTDVAFEALLAELGTTADALLGNTELLKAVLAYHLLGSARTSADWVSGKAIEPVGGGFFKLETAGGVVLTDGRNRLARTTQTDVILDNGALHRIDRVMLPANRTVVETAQNTAQTSTLVAAVNAAGLAGALSASGPFTIFAPVDAAFSALLTELGTTLDALIADTALLTKVLTYHVVPARALKADIVPGQPITSLQGQSLIIDASLKITDANQRVSTIVATDTLASNGVIHLIDRVLLPT